MKTLDRIATVFFFVLAAGTLAAGIITKRFEFIAMTIACLVIGTMAWMDYKQIKKNENRIRRHRSL